LSDDIDNIGYGMINLNDRCLIV